MENRMQYFEEVEKVKPRVYYHYTSLDALFNIVSNRTLWLTSLKSSNDKKELFYTVDDFIRDFEIVFETEKSKNIKKCFEILNSNIHSNIDKFKKECTRKRKPYALCLSDKRDNLTHWDRYAASSTGVCIGINVAAFEVLYSGMATAGFGSSLFDIGKALYTEEDILNFIRRTTIRNMNVLMDVTKEEPREKFIELITKYGYTYIVGICQDIMRFAKNTSFIDEGEVRFYFDKQSIPETIALIDGMADYGNAELCAKIKANFEGFVEEIEIETEKFFLSKSGIRGYHSLCLEEIWGPGLITEIILGPMCVQNRNELLRFLSENGLSGTKVCVSKVPLR
jgi:hypothetical protein